MTRRAKNLNLRMSGASALACAAFLAAASFFSNAAPALAQNAVAAQPTSTSATTTARQKERANKAKKTARNAASNPKPTAAKPAPKGFMETLMEGPRITTTPPPAADWVRAARPDPNAPRPTARTAGPGRPVLTDAQIRANEAQLENLRARHDRVAGRKPPTGKFGSAAGKPQAPEVEKHKPGCALTCSTPISVPRTNRR
jgi:hypothetical protein